MRRYFLVWLLLSCATANPLSASAAELTLDAIDSGWYVRNYAGGKTFYHDPNNRNYTASSSNFRNFFAFDLAGIDRQIESARLRINAGSVQSPYRPQLYRIFEVTSDVSTLIAGGNGLDFIWNDLGSGAELGSRYIGASDAWNVIDIELLPIAVEKLNLASEYFALGGVFGNYPDNGTSAFGSTNYCCVRQLILELAPVPVSIDVKPNSEPNCFNADGNGVIPVAVLGSESFDVSSIDQSTLSFGGATVRVRGNKGPFCGLEDSNADGFNDIVCQFEDNPEYWEPGQDDATLTGALLDGTSIEGTDTICIVP